MLLIRSCRRVLLASVVLIAILGSRHAARAQGAWVGDAKSLTADLALHYAPSTATVITPDIPGCPTSMPACNPITELTYTLGVEWVPIENLSLEAELPLAMVKYTGTMTHLPPGVWDDHNFHTTLTDLRVGARYQVLDEPYVALSPYIAVTIPVMDYEVNGFATGGRHLKQLHLGAAVGRSLNPVLPNLYFTARYEFTLSESYDQNADTSKINQNRSDFDVQVGYLFLDGDLNIAAGGEYRHQHSGVEFTNFVNLPATLTDFHDPILKESYTFLGGNVVYQLTHKVAIGAVARFFIQGYNTRDQSLYGVNVSWRLK